MATIWINFKELRERLDTQAVLSSCNVVVKVKGDQGHGFCPLPTHPKHEGKRKSPSFSVNLKRGIWQCFSCSASGNMIDLVCRLQGMDPDIPGNIREAALLLNERFPQVGRSAKPANPTAKAVAAPVPAKPLTDPKVIVNAPLDFELKNLNFEHPYLPSRGFSPDTINRFGLAFCQKGLMKDRIVIPLHDTEGKLIGYAGRVVDDAAISDDNPRYRFPSGREKNGVRFDFQKSLFVYNGDAVGNDLDELTVVESFSATWWLTQNEIDHVVSVMGASCSVEQGMIIVDLTRPDAVITILTDGDDAGRECAKSIFAEVAPHRTVRWAKLEAGLQPTDIEADTLKELLTR